jgi:hypothetical protein
MRPMMLILPLVVALLSGCTSQDSINATGASLKRIFTVEPKKPYRPHAVAEAYCYRMQSDILCYRRPQPGKEVQFVGRQPVENVGVAVSSGTPQVAPSIEDIHGTLQDDGYPPAVHNFGTAAEAAGNYPTHRYALQPSFANSQQQTQLSSASGSSVSSLNASASTRSSGPRVLMPNQ